MARHGLRDWWRTNHRRFLFAAVITALVSLGTAIAAGLDRVMSAGFQALATVIALPFVLVIGIFVLVMLPFLPVLLIAAVTDTDPGLGGSDVLEELGSKVVGGYFGWIGRRRNPLFWGVPTGLVVALVILAIVAYVRAAPERAAHEQTQQILAQTKQQINDAYEREGHYPERLPEILDGYGRVLAYRVVESRTMSTYTLSSQGKDLGSIDDDLCVQGGVRHTKPSVLRAIARRAVFGAEPEPVFCPRR